MTYISLSVYARNFSVTNYKVSNYSNYINLLFLIQYKVKHCTTGTSHIFFFIFIIFFLLACFLTTYCFQTIMNILFGLDIRRRISEKDEGIYIYDLLENDTVKLRKDKRNN